MSLAAFFAGLRVGEGLQRVRLLKIYDMADKGIRYAILAQNVMVEGDVWWKKLFTTFNEIKWLSEGGDD